MSAQAVPVKKDQVVTHAGAHAHAPKNYARWAATMRLGLWLFFVSDGFVFGGLLVSRFYLLGMHRPHLEQWLGLVVTSVLLVSSFFMNSTD